MASSNITTDSMNSEHKPLKSIKVQTNDGNTFEIDEDIIKQSSVINEYYELWKQSETMIISDEPMKLFNVDSKLFSQVLDFCKYHKNDNKSQKNDDDEEDDPNKDQHGPKRSDDISAWDQEFIQQFTVRNGTLFDIITAANYLGVKSLIEVGLKTIANMVRGKASSEVRDMFTISTNSNEVETSSTN